MRGRCEKMIYEYISSVFGIIKIYIYKLFNLRRIKFKKIPKMNKSFKIAIKRGAKLILGRNFRSRNNVSFRVYNNGVVKSNMMKRKQELAEMSLPIFEKIS